MKRLLLFALLVSPGLPICADSVAAQCKQGDLVFTATGTQNGMFYTTWPGPLGTIRSGLALNAVKMGYGNSGAYAIGTNTGKLYRVYGNGTFATVTTQLTSGCEGIALDQDGAYLIVNAKLNYSNYYTASHK